MKYKEINFKADVLETMDSKFKTDDFMADVDGYNIGFNLLNNTKNNELKVSDSINSYYEILKQNSENRYRIFIKSVSFFVVNGNVDDTADVILKEYVDLTPYTGSNGFKYVVCKNMGINYITFEDIGENFYYNEYNPVLTFMCKDDDENRGYLCDDLRINMMEAFIDYVFEKAGYNYED